MIKTKDHENFFFSLQMLKMQYQSSVHERNVTFVSLATQRRVNGSLIGRKSFLHKKYTTL